MRVKRRNPISWAVVTRGVVAVVALLAFGAVIVAARIWLFVHMVRWAVRS